MIDNQQTKRPSDLRKVADILLNTGLKLGVAQGCVSNSLAVAIYAQHVKEEEEEGVSIPYVILEDYGAIDGDTINISVLPDPTVIRPCSKLHTLYLAHGRPKPHKIFNLIEEDIGDFNRMVYTYRVIYDALWMVKSLTVDAEQVVNFKNNTSLCQISTLVDEVIQSINYF